MLTARKAASAAAALAAMALWLPMTAAGSTIGDQSSELIATSVSGDHGADEQAIRTQAVEYEKFFSNADVAKLTDMWAEDAVYTDEAGNVYRGRESIRKQMSEFFARFGKQRLQVRVESLTFPNADTAIEHGYTKILNWPAYYGEQRYTIVHAKRDGKWQMIDVTESPYLPPATAQSLKDMEWLLGNWKVEGPAGTLNIKCDWLPNKNAISLTSDTVAKDGSKTSQTQFIYWNPRSKRICSWQYDWAGGHGEAWWEKSGPNWIAHARSVEPDGASASATYIFRPLGKDTFSWQSTARRLAGKSLPDTAKLKVTRTGA